MNELFTPLTQEEIEYLDRFLLDRIEEDADTEGKDEGILGITELDGLFTAVVSGPEVIPPSQWLPVVWGGFEPVWESEKEFEQIFMMMMRHMNSIAVALMEYPEDFEPMFHEREVDGKTYVIVDEWCEGYRRGVDLSLESWQADDNTLEKLLAPVWAFTSGTNWRGHDFNIDEVENIQQAIAPNVREIHAYWLSRREEHMSVREPVRRGETKIGRNDLCPCGSGKKYKKCCLH